MKLHFQILIALLLGVGGGALIQFTTEAEPWTGAEFVDAAAGGAELSAVASGSPADKAGLSVGDVVTGVARHRDDPERRVDLTITAADELRATLAQAAIGEAVWLSLEGRPKALPVTVKIDPAGERAEWLFWPAFIADIFLKLLKMLIVPIILTSIIVGVCGVGSGRDLRRMGTKTFAYYVATSLLAVCLGQLLVNVMQPGDGAALGLTPTNEFERVAGQDFWDVLRRMVPENIFASLSENGQMLQVIFFALLFGYFVTQTVEPHKTRMAGVFESAFEVMMQMAKAVLALIPLGVFVLLVKVVGETGFGLFKPLGLYMATVTAGLLIHSCVTLPIILKVIGKVSPVRWFKAMGPALMTAFSTSSSSMTLPVSMETVEHRGKVSNKTTSFVLPLGATINMDGTALYECIGVVFLAQYYEGVSDFTLTMGMQLQIVVMALLASIGAAGIPSAGLVMMLTILGALGLPVEGAALLLAVDRPLDMLRTVVNVWSDSCGAALIARSEGEVPLAEEGLVVDTGG